MSALRPEDVLEALLEALNPVDVPNYLYCTQAEAHALRHDVGAANIKVL